MKNIKEKIETNRNMQYSIKLYIFQVFIFRGKIITSLEYGTEMENLYFKQSSCESTHSRTLTVLSTMIATPVRIFNTHTTKYLEYVYYSFVSTCARVITCVRTHVRLGHN